MARVVNVPILGTIALLLGTVSGCAKPALIHHDGIPREAAASTWCDGQDGTVRSALDANLFRVMADGSVSTVPALAEILVHEAVHRRQLEARRQEGLCHKMLSWADLLAMEVEAYCAGFGVAMHLGRDATEVGQRYAQALAHQFRSFGNWGRIAQAWRHGCPTYRLVWEP